MSAQIIPFPSKSRLEKVDSPGREQKLDALAEAIVKRAARKGITLSAGTVKMIVEALAPPTENRG